MLFVPCYKMLFLCRTASAAVADTAGWQPTEHLWPLEAPIAYLAGAACQSSAVAARVAEAAAAENRASRLRSEWPGRRRRRSGRQARIFRGSCVDRRPPRPGQTSIGGERETVLSLTVGASVCLSSRPRSAGSSRRVIVTRPFVVLDTVSARVRRRDSKRLAAPRRQGGQLMLIGASRAGSGRVKVSK